jgi:ankyrin repeat protein
MTGEEVRALMMAALAPDQGASKLQRVLNVHGPQDLRGEAGAELWALAAAAGNWHAAAIIAELGYCPAGQEELVRFLIRNRLSATDFHGGTAARRLWTHVQTRSTSESTELAAFILRMGRPWRKVELDAALLLAVWGDKGPELLRLLIAEGGNVECSLAEVRTQLGESEEELSYLVRGDATPLVAAAAMRQGRIAAWLECGADPSATDSNGKTALHWRIEHGDAEGVRLLIAAGADVERPNGAGKRPLAIAMTKNGRVLDALLEAGAVPPDADMETRGAKAGALLRLACREGVPIPHTPEGARKLLKTIQGYTRQRESPMMAVEDGYWELLQLLLCAGEKMEGPRDLGRTALHVAALAGDGECVRILLEAGVELEAEDYAGDTPLLLAGVGGDGDGRITSMLLAAGAKAGAKNNQGLTGLHARAKTRPGIGAVKALLAAGADVNGGEENTDRPLHSALRAGDVELVRLLLDGGADPDLPGRDGLVPVCLCGTVEMLELLLAARVKLTAVEPVSTGILRQARCGKEDVFLRLLPLVDACEVRDRGGETLLHVVSWADTSDDAVRVRAVLARVVDCNERDGEGVTALMSAVRYGTEAAVRLLIDAGALRGAVDKSGKTAADHARTKGRWDLAERLED